MKSVTGLWVAAAVLWAASPLRAQNHVCIGQAAEPTMDGAVASDPGWNGAARVDLDLQGIIPQVYARLVRTATHVYVGLSVNTPPLAPTDDDRVVLCLSTSDVAAAWRIHIQPFTDSLPGGSATAAAVQYWRNSSTWKSNNVIAQDPSDSANPAPWLQPAQVRTYYHGASFWEMELKIPIESNLANDDNRTAVYFPPVGSTFKLYVNVLQLSSSGYAFQYPWRKLSKIDPTLLSGTPEPTAWGTASFDQKAGASVILIPSRMGLVAPPCPTNNVVVPYTPPVPFGDCASITDGHLYPTTGPANTFFAKPRNKMAAKVHVLTAFDVSDFGLPAPDDWWTVGYPAGWPAPLSNPVGPVDIAPDGEGSVTLDWLLTYKQSCELAVPEKSIRAQMSRPAEDDVTVFSANPIVRSTDNVNSSVFERDARVGTRGYPATASGRQAFVLTVGKEIVARPAGPPRIVPVPGPASVPGLAAAAANVRAPSPDALIYDDPAEVARRSFPPAVEQTLHWVCRGFRKTGRTFVLDDRPVKLTVADTDPAGGFGYLSGHRGPVERWTSEFTGPELRRKSEGIFELDVPQGQKGLVHTRIEAESFHAWQLRFRLGAAIPHGDFADAVDGGWSELVSLEYRINPMFSVEARLGVSTFDGESGGPDVYAVQHAVNGRATFLDGPFRPFVNAGPGFYANNPGDDDVGINIGAGVGYRLNDRFTLEAAWDYHHVFAEGDDPQFSTLQLGVGLKF